MNNPLQKILFLTVLLITGFSGSVKAQNAAAAMNYDFVITLDQNAALTSDYTFDISSINFKDQAGAEKFFRSLTDNIVSYTVNYAAKKATIHLVLQYKQGWKISDWNDYLSKSAAHYKTQFELFNK